MKVKTNKIIVAFTMLLIICVCFCFGYQKSGFFIDEIYTYGLSNSYYEPFVRDIKDGNMIDKTFKKQELADYITINDDEGLDFASVYYNQTKDVHPPMYYCFINVCSSIFKGEFSKWSMLALNFLFYLITMILLYKTCTKLFENTYIALASVMLYGLSTIGLSTALMIRMYILLTMLTLLLVYLALRFIETEKIHIALLIGLTIYLGLMTQYYYVFYACFMCIAVDIYLIIKKKYKPAIIFSGCALLGGALLLITYPACIDHLFADKLVSGTNAVNNLINVSQYLNKIVDYALDLIFDMTACVAVGAVLAFLVVLRAKDIIRIVKAKEVNLKSLVFIIPAFVTLGAVAILSPVRAVRYLYNIAPIFTVAVAFLAYILKFSFDSFKIKKILGVVNAVVLLVAVLLLIKYPPDYLYPEHEKYNAICETYSDLPCVYFDDNYPAPITQDLMQLLHYDSVFITNNAASEKIQEYLDSQGERDKIIVYVDVSKTWSSGYDAEKILEEFMENNNFAKYDLLYKNGLSQTYILSK